MTINIEAGKSVLGAMLIDHNAANSAFAKVQVEDFGLERHQNIFSAMLRLRDENQPIDAITLVDELDRRGLLQISGGFTYITDLTVFVISAANIEQHIEILHRDRILRELTIARAVEDHDENALEIAEQAIFEIAKRRDRSELQPIGLDVYTAYEELLDTEEKNCVPSGFSDLDDYLNGGLHRGNLNILAAQPRIGKTALALNMAYNATRKGRTVVMFSLEMRKSELLQRMIAAYGAVDLRDVRADKAGDASARALMAADHLTTLPLYITEKAGLTHQDIRAELMRHKLRNPLDLVIIDHLQHMGFRGKAESQNLRVGEITRSLKAVAKELDTPVLLLSQLNRESERRPNKEPILADLRDSGSIEIDADVVMMLHRPAEYDEESEDVHSAMLYLRKNRQGQSRSIRLYWEGKHYKFSSCDQRRDDDE